MYYIYFLFAPKYQRYYIGFSEDVHKRLEQHNDDKNTTSFTAKFKPWELTAFFPVSDSKAEAMKVERFIKKQKSKKFNLKIIEACHRKDTIWLNTLIEDILKKST